MIKFNPKNKLNIPPSVPVKKKHIHLKKNIHTHLLNVFFCALLNMFRKPKKCIYYCVNNTFYSKFLNIVIET